jgi:hypothetical protein
VLFYLIVKHAAPEWHGTPGYYAGQIICTLIALVITWRDPPGWLDEILLGVMKYGVSECRDYLLCLGRRVQAGILGAR